MDIYEKIEKIPRIRLANLPTPVRRLNAVSDKYGKNIWIKRDDLTGVETSGNKIRKLEYSLAAALAQKAEVIITAGGIQSNHARTCAAASAMLGLSSHLVLSISSEPETEGNFLLDKMLGAKITLLNEKKEKISLSEKMKQIADEYTSRGIRAYIIPVGASDGIGNFGYINAMKEIDSQEHEKNVTFDTIVCAAGSGGTYSGLCLGNYIYGLGKRVAGITVCDNREYFTRKSTEIMEETYTILGEQPVRLNTEFIDGYKGLGYAISKEDELKFISEIASLEGMILDPVYTGKAFYGLCCEIGKGTFDDSENILFIHTGGLYGLFPKHGQIADVLR